jgi:hypothetical protein
MRSFHEEPMLMAPSVELASNLLLPPANTVGMTIVLASILVFILYV